MTSLELFGREKEVETLKSCFHRLVNTGPKDIVTEGDVTSSESFLQSEIDKELVFVSGHSGVGKSSLCRSIQEDVNKLDNGLFVEGKFDLITSNEPYSGVAKAFSSICRQLLAGSEDSVAFVGEMISRELKDEAHNLQELIPELKDILGPYANPKARTEDVMGLSSLEIRQKKWKYAFRLLTRALNSVFSPIVLVLDDLQWSDLSSLQVIDYLISDMQNPNRIMIVGCYRSEEVEAGDTLSKSMATLNERKEKFGFNLTEIKLHSCQLDDVNKIIRSKLSINDESEILELAQLCYKRTLGNPFFVLQFTSMLKKEGLLEYNQASSQWTWDMNKVKVRANFMSDVVDLLQGRMTKMSDDLQLLLQYAACIGASFSLATLDIIWQEHGTGKSDAISLLEEMQSEQFIEPYGENGYKWVHDKVQEAALSLSDIVDASFKFKIGKTLVSALAESELKAKLFDVVDMINHGNVTMRPDLAELNLRAAEKARDLSAFVSAKGYVEYGTTLLPRDNWKSHKQLTLALYNLGTKVELALNNREGAMRYCIEVFQQKDVGVMEKLSFHLALIEKLSTGEADDKKEALHMSLRLLKELNYPLMWSHKVVPLQAIHNLLKTMKATKKWVRQGQNTPMKEMKDPRLLAIARLLGFVGYNSYHLEMIFLSTLAICRQVNMAFSHGMNDMIGIALVNIGFISWAVLRDDFSVASATIEKALLVQDTLDPQCEGQAKWIAYTLCLCWSTRFKDAIPVAKECYKSCSRMGDTEYKAHSLALAYIWLPYLSGLPLRRMLNEAPKLIRHFEELQQQEQITSAKMYYQLALLANSDNLSEELEGSIFSAKKDSVTTGPLLATVHFLEGEVLILSNMDKAADRALRDGDKFQKLGPGIFVGMQEMFHRGVALYAAARRHKKRKFRIGANKIRQTVKQWVSDGNPNIEYYDLLLDAEHAALTTKTFGTAHKLYEQAIESAIKLGHLMHSGLCHERYADFLLHARSDSSRAKYHLSEASTFYGQWGSEGKVRQLKLQINGIGAGKGDVLETQRTEIESSHLNL